jgi:hypothetical protein
MGNYFSKEDIELFQEMEIFTVNEAFKIDDELGCTILDGCIDSFVLMLESPARAKGEEARVSYVRFIEKILQNTEKRHFQKVSALIEEKGKKYIF